MAHSPAFRQLMRLFQQAQSENLQQERNTAPRLEGTRWTRRKLIKSATLATASALTTGLIARSDLAWSGANPRIAVIGAGLAGLNAAYQLKKRGLTAMVYEARNRLGGRVLSVTGAIGEGLVADLGGSFVNTDHADVLNLVKEFNLTLFNRLEDAASLPFPGTSYFFGDRLRPEREVANQLRPLARQIFKDASLLDEDFDTVAPRLDQLSVTDYLDRHADKIAAPFIRTLIENTIRTEYGVEPTESSALQLLFNLPTVQGDTVEVLASDEAFFVNGGSGRIIESLAQALAGQIQAQKRLTRIQSRDRGYRLTFSDRSTVNADYVIMAIPFTVLRTVELQVNLPRRFRRFIDEVNLGLNEKVFAGFDQRFWYQQNGFVNEIWTDLGFSTIWNETQRQPNRLDGGLTFYPSANEVLAIRSDNNAMLARKLTNRLRRILPGAEAVTRDQFLRTDWTTDALTKGAYTNFTPGQLTEFGEFLYIESDVAAERQEVNFGNLFFAGEQFSDAFYGFMNGAAETGRLAVESLIRKLRRTV